MSHNNAFVQSINLKKGWNWVSFEVNPWTSTVAEFLNNATAWEPGDGLEIIGDNGEPFLYTYKAVQHPKDKNRMVYFWDNGDNVLEILPRLMYRVYTKNDKTAYVSGGRDFPLLTVNKGWNRIGYLAGINLPLGTALSNYIEMGQPGDIVKSQSEFAVLNEDANGTRSWRGTLKYMRRGEGYMLYRKQNSELTFSYPEYSSGSRYAPRVSNSRMEAPLFENTSGVSMTVVAKAMGIGVEEGDRLTAYRGAEPCGIAEATADGVFYLNIGDVDTATDELNFTIERADETIAVTTRHEIRFKTNAAIGTPSEPASIDFMPMDQLDSEGWYTVGGKRLSRRPIFPGVYIHNGEKVTIK
jgi:hypothetical protein